MAKTCGMCAHGINRLVSCWELDPQGSHHAQNEPACYKFAERKQDGMCSCNKSRGYDDLLERYQQLEQVAKEMYQALTASLSRGKPVRMEEVHAAIIDLSVLGVSLDG